MIHEEICTYEVCKLAKENGFNARTIHYYEANCLNPKAIEHCTGANYFNKYPNAVSAPTQSLLQRWLREEKKIEVYVRNFEKTTNYPQHYWNFITDGNGKTLKVGNKMFDTYELALEDAIAYSLKNFV